MGGEVSSSKLKPIHHHQTKGVDKAHHAKKTDAPKADKPQHAGSKDDFQTAAKTKPPLADGDYGVSHQKAGLPSAHGHISEAEWADPAKLMAKLTQYPHGRKDTQSEAACGAANVLGAAMLSGGPDAAATAIQNAANDPSSTLTAKEKTQLTDIGDRVKAHTATFEDLNKAQELMYRSAHTKISAGDAVDEAIDSGKLNSHEKRELKKALDNVRAAQDDPMKADPKNEATIEKLVGKAFGETVHVNDGYVDVSAKRHTKDIAGMTDGEVGQLAGSTKETVYLQGFDLEKQAKDLKPGQALTVRVGAKHNEATSDHFVTIGRRKDGSYYIYNPDPGKGDATLSLGKDVSGKFLDTIHEYEMRQKKDPNGNMPPGARYSP